MHVSPDRAAPRAPAEELAVPIADYALIGDCHSAALVSKSAAIDWCCFHRFDQRPSFARLLDRKRGGHVVTSPRTGSVCARRSYVDGSNVLETRFESDAGTVVIVDAMSVSGVPFEMPPMELLRTIRCEAGNVDVDVEIAPRFDYGLTLPRVRRYDDGLYGAFAGPDALELETDLEVTIASGSALAGTTSLRAGERRFLRIRSVTPHTLAPERCGGPAVADRVEQAIAFWQGWSSRCTYEGPYRAAIVRSALVLKALTNAPTGAIVAAPTASLPEVLGGERNWDYRYTWLRDAGMHLGALLDLGYADEARAFVAWLERTTGGHAANLQVLYGAGGERCLPELELPLEGYAGSRPVRIGNDATGQRQLDVYGHVAETLHRWVEHGNTLDDDLWELVHGMVDIVDGSYRQPDRGIWEVRSKPAHFVASKVMAWVAVDRALRIAERTGRGAPLERWRTLREDIRNLVLDNGVSRSGEFVRAFGSDATDSALLEMVLYGFVPADDRRWIATFARIDRELVRGPLVRRYLERDGLGGREGSFVMAAFWRVMALARCGRRTEARGAFEALLERANDVGLFAEEIDPDTGAHLGNFPQAFSHIGLVNAALALDA